MAKESKRPKRSARQRWLRRIVFAVGALIGLATVVTLIVMIALSTAWGKEKLRSIAENQLKQALVGGGSIGRIEGSVFGELVVRDLVINDATGLKAIAIKSATLDVQLWPLVSGDVEINRLALDDLRVWARTDRDGNLNLASLPKPKEIPPPASELRLKIDEITVASGEIVIERDGAPTEVLTNFSLASSRLLVKGEELTIALGRARAHSQQRDLPISVSGQLELTPQQTTLTSTEVVVAEAAVAVSRAVIDGSSLTELEGAVDLPAAAFSRFLPAQQWREDLKLTFVRHDGGVAINGTLGASPIDGQLQLISLSPLRGDLELAISAVDAQTFIVNAPRTSIDLKLRGHYDSELMTAVVDADGVIAGRRLDSLHASAEARGERFEGSFNAKGTGGRASGSAELELGQSIVVNSATLDLNISNLDALAGRWLDVRGDVRANLSASGPIETLAVRGTINSNRLQAFGVDATSVRLKPTLTRHGDRAKGELSAQLATLTAGQTRLEKLSISGRSSDGVQATISARGSSREVSASVRATLKLGSESLQVALASASARYRHLEAQAKDSRLSWTFDGPNRGLVDVTRLYVSSNAGQASFSGKATIDGAIRAGKFTATAVNLASLGKLAGTRLRGSADVSAEFDNHRRPTANISLAVRGLGGLETIRNNSDVELDLKLRGRELTISGEIATTAIGNASFAASVLGPSSPFRAEGWSRLGRDAIRSLTLDAKIENPAALSSLHEEVPKRGVISVHAAKAEGEQVVSVDIGGVGLQTRHLDAPADLAIHLDLQGHKVTVGGRASVATHASGDFSSVVTLPGPWFAAPSYRKLGPKIVESLTAEVAELELDWWTARFAPSLKPSGARASAKLTFTPTTGVAILGHFVLPKGGPTERQVSLSSAIDAKIGERESELDLKFEADGKSAGSGRAKMAVGWRNLLEAPPDPLKVAVKGRVELAALPLVFVREVIRTTPLEGDADISGTLTAAVSFEGMIAAPSVSGRASIEDAVLNGVGFKKLSVAGKLRERAFDITAVGDQIKGGRLAAHVQTDLSNEAAKISAGLNAKDFDLSFLRTIVPNRAIGGELTADLVATGTRNNPRYQGSASIAGGSFDPGAPLYLLRDANLSATLKGDTISMSGKALAGSGTVDVKASLRLVDNEPGALRISLETTSLPIESAGVFVRVDSTTKVTGTRTSGKWELRAEILKATVHLPDTLSDELYPTETSEELVFVDEIVEEKVAGPVASVPFEMTLRIRANDSILLRGSQANAVVGANLEVKLGRELRLTGTIRVDQGWVEIAGRRYDVRTAEVSFDGDLVPDLDVQLAYEFSALTLFVDVSGKADAPAVEFSSDPPSYDDAELLAFVLGGNPDESSESSGQTVAAQASGLATGYLVGKISNALTKVTPIDVLRIDTDESSAERIALGKWITNRLLVAYRHRFVSSPKENTGELTFEYRFLKRWLLDGFIGQQQSGADVLWIRRY